MAALAGPALFGTACATNPVTGHREFKLISESREIATGERPEAGILWGTAWFSLAFLVATNSRTNPFVHFLHNDALALLLSVLSYLLLLEHTVRPRRRVVAMMVVLPTLGFLTKQSLVATRSGRCQVQKRSSTTTTCDRVSRHRSR